MAGGGPAEQTRRGAAARSAPPPGTDPAADEEARAFLQRRLGKCALLVAALFALFLGWRLLALAVEIGEGKPGDWRSVPTQAAEVAIFLSVWLVCRGRPRSIRFLRALDVIGVVLGAAAVLAAVFRIPYLVRPDYIAILALTYVMLARAIYVPSTARRTALLGLAIAPALLAVLAYSHHAGHDPSHFTASAGALVQESPRMWAIRWTSIGAVWWLAAVLLATVTSRAFYGLRKDVRDARRLGQYTLLEVLGEGGMGVVYRASHALLRRPTAVKLLPPGNLGEESVARFEREVQLTARLTHSNTVRIFDYGRTPDGIFYYAMELLDGASLDRVVRIGGPLSPARVIHILEQVAGALEEAHGLGLIHRDIKPGNILLTRQGGVPDLVKVVDFGLVKQVAVRGGGEAAPLPAITDVERMAGTPQYMAPEAIATPEAVDARTDLYALGAVGYFLLAGVEVFRAASMLEVCSHHLHTEPLPPSLRVDRLGTAPVPEELEQLVLRCLSKEPSDRPASARELRKALAACRRACPWSEEDARAWWIEHEPALRSGALRRVEPAVVDTTFTVDLTARETANMRVGQGA